MAQSQNLLAVLHIVHKDQSIDITYDFTNIFTSNCFLVLSSQRRNSVEAERKAFWRVPNFTGCTITQYMYLVSYRGHNDLHYTF